MTNAMALRPAGIRLALKSDPILWARAQRALKLTACALLLLSVPSDEGPRHRRAASALNAAPSDRLRLFVREIDR